MTARSGDAPALPNAAQEGIDPSENSASGGVRARLAAAVAAAGGKTEVAARSGISPRSLDYYLVDREMKLGSLVALAGACGVTVEWLATGREPMRADAASPSTQPATNSAPPKLFSIVDMDLLADCLEAAVDQLRRHNPRPSWRRTAQIATLLYDQLKEERALAADQPTDNAAPEVSATDTQL